ncbi:MAG: hypothetical protein ACOYOU_21490 [Kiritimatiellia bacterium]
MQVRNQNFTRGGSEVITAADLAAQLVTTVGATGSDSKIPTEQAVREAITAAGGGGGTSVGGVSIGMVLALTGD